MEVKTQMLQGQVNNMFKENLSAKMKQIRDKHKPFEQEDTAAKNIKQKLMAVAQSEQEIQRVVNNLANVGMKQSVVDDR